MTYKDIQGWFDFDDIYTRVATKQLQNGDSMVEVGSWLGKSTTFMGQKLKELSKEDVTIFAVDIWNDQTGDDIVDGLAKGIQPYDAFCSNIKKCGVDHIIEPVRLDSKEAASVVMDESIKFIFIDALHTYEAVKQDIEAWWDKLEYGCYMGGHDADRPEVRQALNECLPGWYRASERSWLCKKEVNKSMTF